MKPSNDGKASLTGSSTGMQVPAFLANFAESAFDAIIAFDSRGQIEFWNPAAERMFGWKANEALGKTSGELFWPETTLGDQDDQKQWKMEMERGESILREQRMYRKDGTSFWIEYTARAVFDEGGKAAGFVAVYHDISEHKRIEQALRENEERFRSMVDAAPVMIWISGVDKLCTWFNQSWLNFVGRPLERELGNGWTENIHLDDFDRCLQTYNTAFDGRQPFSMVYRMKRRDGKYRWLLDNGVPSYESSNEFIGYMGFCIDITEHKETEESLRAKTVEFETLLQVSPIAFFVAHDPECKRITGNPAGYQLVKLPEKGDKNISKSAPIEEQPGYRVFRDGIELASEDLPMQMAARLGIEVLQESLELRFEDASEKYIFAYARPLIDENGKLRGSVAAMLDITERKHMEREIESMARFPQENPNPILRIHGDGVIAFANAASDNLLRLWNGSVGERLPESEHKLILQTLESGLAIEQEVDCTGIIYSLFYTPIADSGYVNIYGRDITERKRADEALRESEERFRTLANTVPSIVWTAAPDGTILFTNEFWHKYTGSGNEETGRNWTAFLNLDDRERSALAWKHATETVTEYLLETRIRRHDGQDRWFQARALPVRDEVGNVTAWYGVAMDIHDRIEAVHALRESQQQLQFLNETLEMKVNAQTAEVRRLASNLTKAEQRERHRIAHILHEDLQQRLYAVKMQLAFLVDRFKNVDPTMELEFAKTNQQLDQILALTRNLTVELSPPILRDEGLTQALNWLASMMRDQHGLQIEIQAEDSFAIPNKDIQVLLFACVRELLFNVVKHAGVNRAVVTLQRSNDFLSIEVCDEGKGFDIAELKLNTIDKVYDENSQWSFGLPTLRHQLGLLGGQMDIHSEPDTGTRITVTVPYT